MLCRRPSFIYDLLSRNPCVGSRQCTDFCNVGSNTDFLLGVVEMSHYVDLTLEDLGFMKPMEARRYIRTAECRNGGGAVRMLACDLWLFDRANENEHTRQLPPQRIMHVLTVVSLFTPAAQHLSIYWTYSSPPISFIRASPSRVVALAHTC